MPKSMVMFVPHSIFLAVLFALSFVALPATAQDWEGRWIGTLQISKGVELPIVLQLEQRDSAWEAAIGSPKQGVQGFPAQCQIESDSINWCVPQWGAFYRGIYRSECIEGIFTQRGLELNLTFRRGDLVLKRPQTPPAPYPYISEEILLQGPDSTQVIAGTLTIPRQGSKEPVGAVILISGSGQQNRDEEMAGHKPFLVLSDYLTRKGWAVLRCDDRGVDGSQGGKSPTQCTTHDYARDIVVELAALRQDKRISPNRIVLLGHSEGGLIAQMVASQDDKLAGIITLAGPYLRGDSLLKEQRKAIAAAIGLNPLFYSLTEKVNDSICNKAADLSISTESLRSQLYPLIARVMGIENVEKRSETDGQVTTQLDQICSNWYRHFLNIDPADYLRQVYCPVLALFGEKDCQVPYKKNIDRVKEIKSLYPKLKLELQSLPELNHLFQTAKTGLPTEYAEIEETISPHALETIALWLKRLPMKKRTAVAETRTKGAEW